MIRIRGEDRVSIEHGRLAVVVVNYASAGLLERNLVMVEREARAIDQHALVIVVDNWSNAEERRAAATIADAQGWLLIEPRSNSGFGGGVDRKSVV